MPVKRRVEIELGEQPSKRHHTGGKGPYEGGHEETPFPEGVGKILFSCLICLVVKFSLRSWRILPPRRWSVAMFDKMSVVNKLD